MKIITYVQMPDVISAHIAAKSLKQTKLVTIMKGIY